MKKTLQTVQTTLMTNPAKVHKFWRMATVIAVCVSMFLTLTCTAFAETNLVVSIAKGMGQLFDILRAIVIPVAVIALVFAGYQVLMGGEKGMETAKKTVVSIIIAVALVMIAPLILEQVAGWFGDTTSGSDVFTDPDKLINNTDTNTNIH